MATPSDSRTPTDLESSRVGDWPVLAILVLSLFGLIAVLVDDELRRMLRHPYHLTGWMTFLALGTLAFRLRALPTISRKHLLATVAAAWLFAVHVNFDRPFGTLEFVLCIVGGLLFTTSILAFAVGRSAARRPADSIARHRHANLVALHVALVVCLLPLGLLHGVLNHLHGWLSRFSGGRG